MYIVRNITVILVLIIAILTGSGMLLEEDTSPQFQMEKARQELRQAMTKEEAARAVKKINKLSKKYSIPLNHFGESKKPSIAY